MPMMQIRKVRVPMHHLRMTMQMSMGLARRIARFMNVQVMWVMNMSVVMLERFVRMFVIVSLGKVQV